MGCASSKQNRQCRHCQAPYSPVHRSYSMNNEPQRRYKDHENHHHVVALKSSTLGYLKLDDPYGEDAVHFGKAFISRNGSTGDDQKSSNGMDEEDKEFFKMGLIEAKTWSHMIEEKIPKPSPKTPIATPPGEPETINTWELMEGLDDASPLRSPGNFIRSFSFGVVRSPSRDGNAPMDRPKSRFLENKTEEEQPPKQQQQHPMWLQTTDPNGFAPEFDPEIILNFKKSLEELSPSHPFHVRPVSKSESFCGNERVVVYFTSLRGVRKTYEDCCHVRVILKSLGVRVDERDLSMHSGFKEELRELLGEELNRSGGGGGYGLPRVFVGENYIGGAEEIQRMHEEGKLEKLLECCERADNNGTNYACEACDDIRFVPCETCSGSCKIFSGDEFEDQEEHEKEVEEGDYGFQRCPDCNENGLIRCPICCD